MWMGYTVSHDPLLPWLLASGIVGAAALGLHFWQRFGATGRLVLSGPESEIGQIILAGLAIVGLFAAAMSSSEPKKTSRSVSPSRSLPPWSKTRGSIP